MLEERDGWFVKNVKDADWFETPEFGKVAVLQQPDNPFPQTGVNLYVLEPGKPNCRYHREAAQEDFLVLSGECLLLVNGEEHPLKRWDFVHCPPQVSHVFVGAGDGPCALLAIGHRPVTKELWYPKAAIARRHDAETPEETADPKVAYGDLTGWQPGEAPDWAID